MLENSVRMRDHFVLASSSVMAYFQFSSIPPHLRGLDLALAV